MNIATSQTRSRHSASARAVGAHRAQNVPVGETAFSRANVEGAFSLPAYGSISLDAEAGLVIRVRAGCLWVPHHEEHCSVGVGAGEQFVVGRAGELTVLGSRGTQVEFEWPSHNAARGSVH